MNFLDIILIFLEVIATIVWIILEVIAFREGETGFIFGLFLAWLVTISALALPWITIDKKSGMTVGYITSVDKNFFGTTGLYLKTMENSEEEFCIEDDKIIEIAKDNIGNKVKITYGTRVGLYSVGKCDQAPISSIELLEKN